MVDYIILGEDLKDGVKVMPVASSSNVGMIVQYVGTTDANYTSGYFYKCVENSGAYSWQSIKVQKSYSEEQTDILLDSIPVDNLGDIRAKSIDLDELPKVCGFPFILFGTAAPSVTPDFIGQMYIDTANNKVYVATGVTNSSSFKVLN